MQPDFWHQRWQSKQIGFHLHEANPLLVKHFHALKLKQGARVFLPLCGKTLDITWLLSQGFHVAGAELSPIAIDELFKDLNLTPTIKQLGELTHYSAKHIDLFVGDIFALTPATLGHVDAIYDRAALIALPERMRAQYSMHLTALANKAAQLLICIEYDQNIHEGPPFSVETTEVEQRYADTYAFNLLESLEMVDGLKGKYPAIERVWLLSPHHHLSGSGA